MRDVGAWLILQSLFLPFCYAIGNGFPVGASDYNVNLKRLYQKTGLVRESAGRTCAELLSMGMTTSGVYWLKPDTYAQPYQAYCDMESFDGGWQMCYTTKYTQPHLTDDSALAYNDSLPYKTDGYRSNCKNVPFNQIIYIYHVEPHPKNRYRFKKTKFPDPDPPYDQIAYFNYETTAGESLIYFVIAGNSGRNLVAPAIQLHYTELNAFKKQFFVVGKEQEIESAHNELPVDPGRAQFPGSIPTTSEAKGYAENYKTDLKIKERTTDFWRGRGVAYKVTDTGVVLTEQNWKYELVVCDEKSEFPVGLFMSGIEGDSYACYKSCDNWCGDTVTDHYRSSAGKSFCNTTSKEMEWCVGKEAEADDTKIGPGRSAGTSFKENGYPHRSYKLMSVGIRYRVSLPVSQSAGDASGQTQQIHYPMAMTY